MPFYTGEQSMDPPLQVPSTLDSYSNLEFSRSVSQNHLTFGAGGAGGMGSGSNDHHDDMRENERTLQLPSADASNLHAPMPRYGESDPAPWLERTVEEPTFRTSSQTVKRPQHVYTGYRNTAGSDFGTRYSHAPQDSGYGTHALYSSDHFSQHGNDTQSMLRDVEHVQQITATVSLGYPPPMQAAMGSHAAASSVEVASRAHNSGWNLPSNTTPTHRYCEIQGCQHRENRKLMNLSDYR